MDYATSFGIITLAALIQTSFQLSISMVTLLSGHSLGKHANNNRTMRLVGGFLFGVIVMTMLSVSFIAYTGSLLFSHGIPPAAWAVVCGLMLGLGATVWVFYYRRSVGTSLWLPRSMARYLAERTKATQYAAESFGLGLTSVLAEGLFIVAPATGAALAMLYLPVGLQLVGIVLYTLIASLGMLIVVMLIGSGHKLSHIQKWREQNKRFLQFAAGSALIVLGFYIYANQVFTGHVYSLGVF